MKNKKFEIWPVAIIASMALFMGGVVTAVLVMVNHDVPLVSDDYYAQEIAYQGRIDNEKRVEDDGRKPVFNYLKTTDALELSLAKDSLTAQSEGKITFFRPADPTQDFSVQLTLDTTGKQWIDLRNANPGLWVVQMEWQEAGRSYYFEQKMEL